MTDLLRTFNPASRKSDFKFPGLRYFLFLEDLYNEDNLYKIKQIKI